MPDAKKQEQRRRVLKTRAEEERRRMDQAEADYLYGQAKTAYRKGDRSAAARMAKQATRLDPGNAACLALLGTIHWDSKQFADALSCFGLARKHWPQEPGLIYNSALAHAALGQLPEALQDFELFVQFAESAPNRWREMRQTARQQVEVLRHKLAEREARTPSAAKPTPISEPPPTLVPSAPPEALSDIPRATVEFLPLPQPKFQANAMGRLTDYLLRQRLQELRLAQSFEDLICLPSLTGVDTYVYQHETVRRVLRHFKGRALLADEVGLGKTIEACLVLKEYWMRGMVRRVLVLTPPSLVAQWKGELLEKFALVAASPDGAEFRRHPGKFWTQEPLVVSSIAMARMEIHMQAITSVSWDMVIIDEAHCLKNRTSANWKLVNALQKKFILMLTATPVENHLIELYNLITVLKPGLLATEEEFKKLFVTPGKPNTPRNAARLHELLKEVMIRNTRSVADVRLPHRIATSIVVAPSADETELYELTSRFVRRRRQTGDGGALAYEWLQRHAGSSPYTLSLAVGRMLNEPPEGGARPDRGALERIQELASSIRESGKGQRLGEMLRAHGGKAVVFTEFIHTLEYLEQICQQHAIRHAVFRGNMSRTEKDMAITCFRDEVPVLLSTGTGGEGRNLQFADTVINFDLPWSPMRLEQRVGRVHRIGQTHEVFVFNFCQQGSLEEQILRVLHDKINMFELVVGEMDTILGSADEAQDFADLVLELWLSHNDRRERERAFDELGERLLAAKQHHLETKQLEQTLFQRDLEI